MKKIAAVFLTILLLLSSASYAEELLPAELSEGSRLIGLLITTEDLTAYTGESGILFASRLQSEPESDPEYTFGEVRGLRLICFILPDVSGEGSHIVSNVDDRFASVDFDVNEDSSTVSMDAVIYFVPGQVDTRFFFNPVLMATSGQVFSVPGDFMAMNIAMNPPGSSVGQTIRDERKHTESGSETNDTTSINVQINAVQEPMEIRLLQFSEKHVLLKSEAYPPGAVPDQLFPLPETAYLLLETVEKNGKGTLFIRRQAISQDADYLNTISCENDGICIYHYHEVLWK